MEPIIKKVDDFRFDLSYPQIPDFVLNLNFQPLVEFFNLSGTFCLLHWQSKPFGIRRFGVFCNSSNSYQSIAWNQLEILANPRPIQVDESVVKTIPVAMLLFENSVLSKGQYFQILKS